MHRYLLIAVCFALIATTSCLRSIIPAPSSVSSNGSRDLPANNGLCLVCHLDFDDDPIAADHLRQGITCAHCHGKSTAHMHDETLMTSPDILYGRAEVETMCMSCHQPHKDPKAVDIFRSKWLGRKRENGRSITTGSTCTDCHGLHTIPRR